MRDGAVRASFLNECGFAPHHVRLLHQIHSHTIRDTVEAAPSTADLTSDERIDGDGLICSNGDTPIAVGVGDCVPILLHDRVTKAYGLLHSGWRGTGILGKAIERLVDDGSRTEDLVVHLGPCISADSYIVDHGRAAEFRKWGADCVVQRDDGPYLDLRAANVAIAHKHGVRDVSVADHCTYLDPRLGSYRREGREYDGMLVVLGRQRTGFQSADHR